MSSISRRLAKLERHSFSRGTDEGWKAFFAAGLPLLSDYQLERLEILYLKICDHPKAEGGEAWMTFAHAVSLLDPEEGREMFDIFATMGMEIEDLDL